MAHLVLYRNFRPKTFDEVIGQDHIVKTLKNQIENNSFGHAYLFCGTRGTGKTSCAKIFARAVNCLNPNNGNPCGECEACLSNLNGGNLDIIEIDAASNNRVDEIRDLREKIGYLPSVNKYKVYIVDEVHMLTDSAFNALLKTLEEPPAHALFILATTEPQKLPATILSRCMRFDFKLVSEDDLILHLQNVFTKSGISFDQESLKLIAKNGRGSVRDTLSIAEMCASYSNNKVTYSSCQECLGVTDSETIIEILSSVLSGDAKQLLKVLEKLKISGKNFSNLVADLIENISALLTIKITDSANEILKLPASIYENLKQLASQSNSTRLVSMLKMLSETESQLKLSLNADMVVQTTLLSLIFERNEIENLKFRIEQLEKQAFNCSTRIDQSKVNSQPQVEQKIDTQPQSKDSFINVDSKHEVKIEVDFGEDDHNQKNLSAKKTFGELAQNLRKSGKMMLYAMLGDVVVAQCENTLIMETNGATFSGLMENKKQLEDELKKISSFELEIVEKTNNPSQTVEEFLKEKFGDKLQIV